MNRVLLIDDDPDDQLFYTDAFRIIDPDIICEAAVNGKIAIEILKGKPELPDLIILDLNMPVMDGFEFLEQLHSESKFEGIPVAIVTTSGRKEDLERSLEFGVCYYLIKPNDFNVLCDSLRRLVMENCQ